MKDRFLVCEDGVGAVPVLEGAGIGVVARVVEFFEKRGDVLKRFTGIVGFGGAVAPPVVVIE